MNKSILIIDTPNKCRECGFYYKDNRMSCYIDDYIKDCKGACPLKPLPQKVDEIGIEETMINGYRGREIILEKVIEKARQQGYNKCINEILEGNNV